MAYGQTPWPFVMLPLLGLTQVALFLTMAAMMVSLVNTGAILTWSLPEDVPLWGAVLILFVAYQIAVSPLRAAQQWSGSPAAQPQPAWYGFWSLVLWLIAMAFAGWLVLNHLPEIREFLQRVPELFQDFADAFRHLFSRSAR